MAATITEELKEAMRRDYAILGSVAEVARKHGVKHETAKRACLFGPTSIKTPLEQSQHDLKIAGANRQIDSLRSKYAALLAEYQSLQSVHHAALEIRDNWRPVAPITPRKKSAESCSVAVAVASDWHVEETIDPKTVSNLNEFNLDIASSRIERFWQSVMSLVEMSRSSTKIDTMVVALLGDFISGYIHEELVESNSLSPTQAIVWAGEKIEAGLRFLMDEGKFARIVCPCCPGNHGRTTIKPRVSTATQNSYEWLLYYMLARQIPEIEWQLPTGYHNLLTVYNTRIRFHHGEDIKYQGGVGGITIPLNKAIAQWNKAKHADLDVMGHWHQRISSRQANVNGSLVGYNAFSVHIKAEYEPPQQSFFLIHPHRGRTVEAPIFVGGEFN